MKLLPLNQKHTCTRLPDRLVIYINITSRWKLEGLNEAGKNKATGYVLVKAKLFPLNHKQKKVASLEAKRLKICDIFFFFNFPKFFFFFSRWEGEGVNEVGKNKANGDILVKVNPRFYRPTEVVSSYFYLLAGS